MLPASREGNRCVEEEGRAMSSQSSRSFPSWYTTVGVILLMATGGALIVALFMGIVMHLDPSTPSSKCSTVTQPTAPRATPSK